jgi:tRNA(Ile)-lysidine synthase
VALMVLAARWRKSLKRGPTLSAVTVDHGLRKKSKAEATAVAKLARKLGVTHRIVRWTGSKPKTGLPQAARQARYRLLSQTARQVGAAHILTAHTLDDQAETVLIRLLRGSGITGLAGMARMTTVPENGEGEIKLVRPLLDIAKARLIATLKAEKIPFADDPTNRDPRFTRARLRGLMPLLAQEGLDARRLALLALRLKRADTAIEAMVDAAAETLALDAPPGTVALEKPGCCILPAEVVIRVIGRAISTLGDEGPVELGKLEALFDALKAAQKAGNPFRRSLAGAVVTLATGKITVERAPPRRTTTLTTRRRGRSKANAKDAKPR